MNRFFDFSNGSWATVFGIPVYGRASDKWWHKASVLPVFRLGNKVHNAFWRFRHRYVRRHQYNRIDTLLSPGYYDIDTLMLNGMFALLRRYVEDENGGIEKIRSFSRELRSDPDPNAPEGIQERQAASQDEAAELYDWWMRAYPAMVARRQELMNALYGDGRMSFDEVEGTGVSRMVMRPFEGEEVDLHRELDEIEKTIDREEQEMLHRLIDVRRSLWT